MLSVSELRVFSGRADYHFTHDFVQVDGVLYVVRENLAYKDCNECGRSVALPMLSLHLKVLNFLKEQPICKYLFL